MICYRTCSQVFPKRSVNQKQKLQQARYPQCMDTKPISSCFFIASYSMLLNSVAQELKPLSISPLQGKTTSGCLQLPIMGLVSNRHIRNEYSPFFNGCIQETSTRAQGLDCRIARRS